jgi:hypothetical protein
MATVNENAFLIDAGIDADDDLCEICYSNKIDNDLACSTCSKSTCISCCNLFKSRKYEYIAKDKCSYNDLQNEMTIQYDCPHCRGNNSKSICDFKDKNVILKAFDRNTNDISLKNVEQSAKTNENIEMLRLLLYEYVNKDLETNDTKYYDEQFLIHSKGLNDWCLDYIEECEQRYFHINMITSWEHYTEPQRMIMIYRYRSMIIDVETLKQELEEAHNVKIDLINQVDTAERKLAFNNLIPHERYDAELINERKKNKELTDKYNCLANKYNRLTKQFVAMSNASSEIIDNITVAINNVKRSSKKQTIKIIKQYLQNIVAFTVNIPNI